MPHHQQIPPVKALIGLLSCFFALTAQPTFADEPRPPNLVIFIADDLGYDDVGINNPIIDTPNIDLLGNQSVRFSQFYANSSCAPTRASLLTGRHFLRTGVWGVHAGRDYIHLNERLLPESLRDAGYTTGMFGKWHSGRSEGYFPWNRGFDVSHMAKLYLYDDSEDASDNFNRRGQSIVGWSETHFADEAIEFIETNQASPFFLYVPFMSPHNPWRAPESHIQKYRDQGRSESLAVYLGMVEFMDVQVGRILAKIDALDLSNDTLVMFLSDNGPTRGGGPRPEGQSGGDYVTDGADWTARNPSGLRSSKGAIYENGIRTVFFVRWPGTYTPGDVDKPAHVYDLYPSLVDILNLTEPIDRLPFDGISLKALFEDPNDTDPVWMSRGIIHTRSNPEATIGPRGVSPLQHPSVNKEDNPELFTFEQMDLALRRGHDKYIKVDGNAALYDISVDPTESNPVNNPTKLAAMEAEMRTWWDSILADPQSFTKPLSIIGSDDPEARNFYVYATSAERTFGNARVSSHFVDEWDAPGDVIRIQTDIRRAGRYRVEVHYVANTSPDADFTLSIGGEQLTATLDQEIPISDRLEKADHGYRRDLVQDLGVINLFDTGRQDLVFELTNTPAASDFRVVFFNFRDESRHDSDTIAYWEFEQDRFFLDSSPDYNDLREIGSVTQAPSIFPSTAHFAEMNGQMALISQAATTEAFYLKDPFDNSQSFTIEAYVQMDEVASSPAIAGQYVGSGDRGWRFYLDPDGSLVVGLPLSATAERFYGSSLQVIPGKQFYVAASIDLDDLATNEASVTFYLQNLTDQLPLQTETVSRTNQSGIVDSTGDLFIGAQSQTAKRMNGAIDQVRLSMGIRDAVPGGSSGDLLAIRPNPRPEILSFENQATGLYRLEFKSVDAPAHHWLRGTGDLSSDSWTFFPHAPDALTTPERSDLGNSSSTGSTNREIYIQSDEEQQFFRIESYR